MSEDKQPRLHWEELYMGIALITSQRSPDTKLKVGACTVSEDGKVLGVGYNASPYGSDWPKDAEKHDAVVHAELNAILHSSGSLKNATIYTTMYPCWQCAKVIVQSGINRVVYLQIKDGRPEDNNFKIDVAKRILRKKRIIPEAFHEMRKGLLRTDQQLSFNFHNTRGENNEPLPKFMLNFASWDFNKNRLLD